MRKISIDKLNEELSDIEIKILQYLAIVDEIASLRGNGSFEAYFEPSNDTKIYAESLTIKGYLSKKGFEYGLTKKARELLYMS